MTTSDKYPKKEEWGPGPWQDEPDRMEFWSHGLRCFMCRNEVYGSWCGYVAVPKGHPLHGASYDAAEEAGLRAHGGLTYAGEAVRDDITEAPEGAWWLGFDCMHAWDLWPGSEAMARSIGMPGPVLRFSREVYRDEAYVRAECESLAAQLMAATTGANMNSANEEQAASYELGEREGEPLIKCQRCGLLSFHPQDIAARYCGHCQQYHAELREAKP